MSNLAREYTRKNGCPTYNFTMVVVQHPKTSAFLAVKELHNRGWWLPAGASDPGESFKDGAYRICKQEAGIHVTLKGILRVEYSGFGKRYARLRIVYFAVPADPTEKTKHKSKKDQFSESASWFTVLELNELRRVSPGLRGPELLQWGNYVENGGTIYPLTILTPEIHKIPRLRAPSVVIQTENDDDHSRLSNNNAMHNTMLNSRTSSDLKAANDSKSNGHRPGSDVDLVHFRSGFGKDFLHALSKGDAKKIKLLLKDKKVRINARSLGHKRWTPLHYAVYCRKPAVVRLLLAFGADIYASTNQRQTSLHLACKSCLQIMQMLLKHGASSLVQNVDGDTPFHIAARFARRSGNKEIYNALKGHNSSVSKFAFTMRNNKGQTPVDVLKERKPKERKPKKK